jgi:hypothetical protein
VGTRTPPKAGGEVAGKVPRKFYVSFFEGMAPARLKSGELLGCSIVPTEHYR